MADLPVLVVGAGPAGLMAAQVLAESGRTVQVYEQMPSAGRKFLRAGVGGLNLTHSEAADDFRQRYTPAQTVADWLQHLDASDVRAWAAQLGIETFTGSSGRVFPVQKKASPLLRAWLRRLSDLGVSLHTRHRWLGWEWQNAAGQQVQRHRFETPDGVQYIEASACVLALGGGSWARLGSDGRWLSVLADAGVAVRQFAASNCGFDYRWSTIMQQGFAGEPLKTVTLSLLSGDQVLFRRRGEALISRHGIQGSVVYAASRWIQDNIAAHGAAHLHWDLMPDHDQSMIEARLSKARGKESLGNFLRKRLGLSPVKIALLRELAPDRMATPQTLAASIKALPMTVHQARPTDEAISTTGGVVLTQVDSRLMSNTHPGVFFAGEMLDWDAPTGGYLLTACLASGKVAAEGVLNYSGAKSGHFARDKRIGPD